ncbi:MAG: hypothetical protein M3042_03540 [Actinomycetota bacterium]|nr:hypothetical protein [Actinomycetota bacterium]
MRRLLYLAGAAFVVWGAYGLATTTRHPRPLPWLAFFLGGVAGHDGLVAPLVIAIGVLVARFAPDRWRPYLVSGLILTGVVGLLAFPFVRRYGARSDNPSILPLDYTRGLIVTLAAVWLGVVALAVTRESIRRAGTGRRRAGVPGPPAPAAGGGPDRTAPAGPAEP